MANFVRYQSRQPVSIKKVNAFLTRAAGNLPGYKPFEPGDPVLARLHPKTLPDLEALSPLELRITGTLNRRQPPWDRFRQVLDSYSGKARLTVTVVYESREIAQRPSSGEMVRAGFREGARQIYFNTNTAYQIGPARHYGLMAQALSAAVLPLELHDEGEAFRGEQFFLTHKNQEDLWISAAYLPQQRNPSGFRCGVSEKSTEEMVAAVAAVVDQLGSGRRFAYEWSIGCTPRHPDAAEQSRQIYDQVKKAPETFQGQKLEIVIDFRLEALENLDMIRQLCGPKDRVLTDLGGFRESDVNPVGVDLITRQDGFWIEVDARVPFETAQLSRLLGESLVATVRS